MLRGAELYSSDPRRQLGSARPLSTPATNKKRLNTSQKKETASTLMSDTVRPTTDPNQNGVDERQNGVVKTKTDPRQNYLRATVSER